MSDEGREPKLDRRSFIAAAGLGAGVVAAGVAGSKLAKGGSSGAPPAPELSSDVDALFGDLTKGSQGSTLDQWRVVAVYGVHLGAIPVVMVGPNGKPYQVDVLKRDPNGPDGVGNTPSLSLFVSNRGDGKRATDESEGLGAIRLADALTARQRAGAKAPTLMTLRERHSAYPNAGFSVRL